MDQGSSPDKEFTSPGKVWEQLDEVTRAHVINLFAHLAYEFIVIQQDVKSKEDTDVSRRRAKEGYI
jgi:hypothetical protein